MQEVDEREAETLPSAIFFDQITIFLATVVS